MVALDTSSLFAFYAGDDGVDVEQIDRAFFNSHAVLPPIVLAEILSDPKLNPNIEKNIRLIPCLDITKGYWTRAGGLRRKVLKKKFKANLADSLIAQVCIDHSMSLITRDGDFKSFQAFGLKLI